MADYRFGEAEVAAAVVVGHELSSVVGQPQLEVLVVQLVALVVVLPN